jgi:hypothetical protein
MQCAKAAGHQEYPDPDGLEGGALLVARPPAQRAPDRKGDPGEAGRAADNAVEYADCAVGCLARGHRRELWPYQAVKAEKHQNNPDRNPKGCGRGPALQLDAKRHPDHGAGQKRQQAGRLYRPAQLPDRHALHDQSVGHD